jgi:hypothetical protein
MAHLLIQHAVEDFSTWKAGYDDHKPVRDGAGLTELHLLQGYEDPNYVVLMFETNDLAKAREFTTSDDLKEVMARLGVIGAPQVVELQ